GDRLMLNGRDVTGALSEPEIGDLASRFSAIESVRDRMRELQRASGARGGIVMEGRDIGSVIFPDAEFKFFLDADVKVRAERRFAELKAKGAADEYQQVLDQLVERDQRDRTRKIAPLVCAPGAIVVDSSRLS